MALTKIPIFLDYFSKLVGIFLFVLKYVYLFASKDN